MLGRSVRREATPDVGWIQIGIVSAVLAAAMLAGCLAPLEGTPSSSEATEEANQPEIAVTGPTRLPIVGFEPSIEIGPKGTLYVTARHALTVDPPSSASPLIYSIDDGATWQPVPAPAEARQVHPGSEPTIATDAEGDLYLVDTYFADSTFSQWELEDGRPTWTQSRAIQGTVGLDDRPWIVAQGDGRLYLVANNAVSLPGPDDLTAQENPSRIWIYVSDDHARTWLPVHGISESQWCNLVAAEDPGTVHASCVLMDDQILAGQGDDEGEPIRHVTTTDGGETWSSTQVAIAERELSDTFTGIALDGTGQPYVAWPDGARDDERGGDHVEVATLDGEGWRVHNLSTPAGVVEDVWMTGRGQTLAMAFYGAPAEDEPDETRWYPYVAVSTGSHDAWETRRLVQEPVATGPSSPEDFLQTSIDPEGDVHVVWHDELNSTQPPIDGLPEEDAVMHTQILVERSKPP